VTEQTGIMQTKATASLRYLNHGIAKGKCYALLGPCWG